MLQSQLLAKPMTIGFIDIPLLSTGVGFSPQKAQSAFCVKQDQTVEIKVKIERKDEYQLIILYRHTIFKGVCNLDHCFQVGCSHF